MDKHSDQEELLSDVEFAQEEADFVQDFILEEQVGFLLRKAYQRHQTIFTALMAEGLTPTQFSTLFRLLVSSEPVSQNALGRSVAMDAATTKGVIARLQAQGLVTTERDTEDRRRYLLHSTKQGRAVLKDALRSVQNISEATLAPLSKREQSTFLRLLAKLG